MMKVLSVDNLFTRNFVSIRCSSPQGEMKLDWRDSSYVCFLHDEFHGAIGLLQNLYFGPVNWVVIRPCMFGYGGFVGKASRASVSMLLQTCL